MPSGETRNFGDNLKSVRTHFAPGSNGWSFPLDYKKFHLNCMVAAPGILLIAGKKLKEVCASHAVPAIVTRLIKLASSKKATAAT